MSKNFRRIVETFIMPEIDRSNKTPLSKISSGEMFYSQNGVLKASKTGKESSPVPGGAVDYAGIASEKAAVTFRKSGKYAFDTWISQYETVLLIRDKYETAGSYLVPFKLIPPGKTDEVQAVIEINSKEINPEKVIFKTRKGTEFERKYKSSDKSYTITVSGGEPGDGQEVYALHPDGKGGYFNLGKLIVVSYPERTYHLRAVSVNGATVNGNALENKLNEIYIYMLSGKFEHPGGFNMLSIEGWTTKVVNEAAERGFLPNTKDFDDFIWNTYNRPWIENALQRGDDIIIWSDPINSRSGFYKMELDFIQSKASQYGYDYNNGIQTGIFSK